MCGPNWAERDMLIGQEAREKVCLQLGMLVITHSWASVLFFSFCVFGIFKDFYSCIHLEKLTSLDLSFFLMGRFQHYDEIVLFGFSWVFWHFRRLSFFYSLSVWLHELSPFLPVAPGIVNYIWWVREKESIYLSKKKGDRTSTADSFIGRCNFILKALTWDIMKPEKDITLQLINNRQEKDINDLSLMQLVLWT